jgi:hypothetical protein
MAARGAMVLEFGMKPTIMTYQTSLLQVIGKGDLTMITLKGFATGPT